MSSPINNIAATFSAITTTTTSSSPRTSLLCNPCLTTASWNPHSSLSYSYKSSLIDLYGSPTPLPIRSFPTIDSSFNRNQLQSSDRIQVSIGSKLLNNIPLSYLDGSGAVRSVSLNSLCKGKRRAVVIGVSAAFSPNCTRFVKRIEMAEASRGTDLFVCVATNDAFVMKAWGDSLAVDFDKWKMLSDGYGEVWKELGVLRGDRGFQRFWLSTSYGFVTRMSFNDDGDSGDQDYGKVPVYGMDMAS